MSWLAAMGGALGIMIGDAKPSGIDGFSSGERARWCYSKAQDVCEKEKGEGPQCSGEFDLYKYVSIACPEMKVEESVSPSSVLVK